MIRAHHYRAVPYIAAALLLLSFTAAGLAADGVSGRWDCVSTTGDGDEIHTILTVTEGDGKINATLKDDDGEWIVSKLKFENNVLSFTVTRDADYDVIMNVNGDKMDGKWSGNGMDGKITATRHKA